MPIKSSSSSDPGSASARAMPSAACASSTAPLVSIRGEFFWTRPPNSSPVVPSSPRRV
jgi:hypothetical protein